MFRPSAAASYKPAHGGYPGAVEVKRAPLIVPGSFGDGACGMALLRLDGEESPYDTRMVDFKKQHRVVQPWGAK